MRPSARSAAAWFVGLAALWVWVWLILRYLEPHWSASVVLYAEAASTIFTVALWIWNARQSRPVQSPLDWIAFFAISLLIAVLFLEIDCSGSLHFEDGALACTTLGGGFTIGFTLAALGMSVAALPSALRALLLSRPTEGNPGVQDA